VAVLAAGLVLASPPASACSCAPPVVEELVPDAGAVFVGREVERSDTGQGGFEPVAVTFEVEEALKGSMPETIQVRTGTGGGDCGVGSLADQGPVGVVAFLGEDDQQLSISICGSIFTPAEVRAVFVAPGEEPEGGGPPYARTGEIVVPPPPPSDDGISPWLLAAGAGAVLAGAAAIVLVVRRRRHPPIEPA
jgi:hypothetical protein